jgi:hypothetical protein
LPRCTHSCYQGLGLWFKLLERAPQFISEHAELFAQLVPISMLELDPAVAKHVARILEAYLLLAGPALLARQGAPQEVAGIMDRLLESQSIVVLKVLFSLIQLYPAQLLPAMESLLMKLFFRLLVFSSQVFIPSDHNARAYEPAQHTPVFMMMVCRRRKRS